jgi:hypothetical protein
VAPPISTADGEDESIKAGGKSPVDFKSPALLISKAQEVKTQPPRFLKNAPCGVSRVATSS